VAGIGVYRTLATQPQWLLLGKADSSKVVNLMKMGGWFRPKAASQMTMQPDDYPLNSMDAFEFASSITERNDSQYLR
jgi:hypothetical protein